MGGIRSSLVSMCISNWSSAVHSLLLATLAKQIVIVFKGKRSVTNAAFVLLQNIDLAIRPACDSGSCSFHIRGCLCFVLQNRQSTETAELCWSFPS